MKADKAAADRKWEAERRALAAFLRRHGQNAFDHEGNGDLRKRVAKIKRTL